MSIIEPHDELRQIAEAIYDRSEEQEVFTDQQPFAVIDMAGQDHKLIREFVPLYTIVGETRPRVRKASITWGIDQEEKLNFLDKYYEENNLLDEASEKEAILAASLFLSGKQRYVEAGRDRAPDGSIYALGMIAVYSYTEYEGRDETGAPANFNDFLSGRIQRLLHSPVEKLSAKLIVPRALIRLLADDIPDFAELNRLPVSDNSGSTNALTGEAVVLGALLHVLAPDNTVHPNLKKILF